MSKLNDFMLQFGTDKFLHFVGGACVVGITHSWFMLAVVAIGKELYDYQDYGNFSRGDIVATVLGGVFAHYAAIVWAMIPFTIY